MKQLLRKNSLLLVGALLGGTAGFLYWKLVGCSSGACAITSKPLNSTLYGVLMGALLFLIFTKEKKSV